MLEKEYLSALNNISNAITSDLYLGDVLGLIVTMTANVMHAKICALWLLDKDLGELRIRATQAIGREYLKARTLKLGEGVVGLVAKDRKPISIINVQEDARYKEKELAKKEHLVSMLSVPMLVKNKVIGVVSCYTNSEYKFTKSDIELLSTVTNQAAVAIENSELIIQTKIIQGELDTRKKVEKAKGVLAHEQGITEYEAYNLIRKSSMNKRVPMKEIAEAIILSYEMRNTVR
jgi:signal transduction protein with GAF and PtsI domain